MRYRMIWTALLIAALNSGTGLLYTNVAFADAVSVANNHIYPSLPIQTPNPLVPDAAEEPEPNQDVFPDYSNFVAMPIPDAQETVSSSAETGNEGALISYDVVTGVETMSLADIAVAAETMDSNATEAYAPPPSPDEDNVIQIPQEVAAPSAFSGLTPIDSPSTNSSWSPTVKLYIITGSNQFGTCSGALIDPHWVLTVGHCIYDRVSGWAKSVRVVPAYESGAEPFKYAWATSLNSFVGWTRDQNRAWDMGFIYVDEPIGALTGWYGFGYNTVSSFFTQQRFTNTGYPTEAPFDGQKMYKREGSFDNVSTDIVYHNNWTYGGQNGSPSWTNATVYAVTATRSSTNSGQTRLTGPKFDTILQAIRKRVPTTFNLMPLATRVGSSIVGANGALPRISIALHNYSSVSWNGNVNMKIYLSSNQLITTDDLLLGTMRYQGQLAAKATTWVSALGLSIPASVRGGNYWIGVIIDSNDADQGDNATDERWVAPILVPFRLYLPLLR